MNLIVYESILASSPPPREINVLVTATGLSWGVVTGLFIGERDWV
jgi:hypothetical protein